MCLSGLCCLLTLVLLPCKILPIASIVLDIWYLWNPTVAQMRAWVPSFNLQHESSLYIVWLGHNLQKSLADFREMTPKIATACVNCSTKLFSWQHFWCLYCVEKKGRAASIVLTAASSHMGGGWRAKWKKGEWKIWLMSSCSCCMVFPI